MEGLAIRFGAKGRFAGPLIGGVTSAFGAMAGAFAGGMVAKVVSGKAGEARRAPCKHAHTKMITIDKQYVYLYRYIYIYIIHIVVCVCHTHGVLRFG